MVYLEFRKKPRRGDSARNEVRDVGLPYLGSAWAQIGIGKERAKALKERKSGLPNHFSGRWA